MAEMVAKGYIKLEDNIQAKVQEISRGLDSIKNSMNGFGSNALANFGRIALGLQAINLAGREVFNLFKSGLVVNMDTESAKNGLAGILMTAYEIKDATGKKLAGGEAFKEALNVSERMMKQIKINAINTAASSKEILDATLQGTAAGATAGLKEYQTVEISTLVANIAKTQRMAEGQVGQELRALLTGKIDKSAAIGTQLGFGPGGALQKEYKAALEGGKVYDFLMDKMGTFSIAAAEQAKTLAGVWDAAQESFIIFKGEISKGLARELTRISKDMDEIFDKKLGTFNQKFMPLINSFSAVGTIIGSEISTSFDRVLDQVADFGQAVQDDATYINLVSVGLEEVKSLGSEIFGIFGDIWETTNDIGKIFIDTMNPAIDDGADGISKMATNTEILIGFVEALRVTFALIRDIITDVIGALRIIAGSGIHVVSDLATAGNTAMAKISAAFGNKEAALKYRAYNETIEKDYRKFAESLMFENNTLMKNFDKDGVAGLFTNTAEAANEGANALNKARQRQSEAMNSALDDQKQILMMAQIQDGYKGKTKVDLTPKYQRKGKGSGGSSDGNPEKVAFDEAMKRYEKLISVADKTYKRLEDIEKDKLKAMEISTNDYFDNKAKLLEEDIAVHKKAYQSELEELNKYLSKAKNAGEKQRINDRIKSVNEKMNTDDDKFLDEKEKQQIERNIALEEVKKRNNNLEIDYLNLIGKTTEAEIKKANQKYEELLKNKDNTKELNEQLEIMKQMDILQSKINGLKSNYDTITESVALSERSIQLLKDNGQIGELSYLSKIRDIRKENADMQISLIEEEIELEKQRLAVLSQSNPAGTETQNSRNKILGYQNQIKEIQNSTDPLAQRFGEIGQNAIGSFFDDLTSGTKTASQAFRDLFGSIEKDITSLVSKNLSTQLMNSLFGNASNGGSGSSGFGSFFSNLLGGSGGGSSGGAGGFFSNLFSGMFAEGGNVLPSDKPILVGERGPEIWQPSGSGRILNNGQSGKVGGGSSNVNINVHGATDANSFKQSQGQIVSGISREMARQNKRYN